MRTVEEIQAEIEAASQRRDEERLLRLADELHGLGTREAQAAEYGLRGEIHWKSGNLPDALTCYQRCLELRQALGQVEAAAHTASKLGIVYGSMGDYAEALECQHRARSSFDALEHRAGLAATSTNIGIVHYFTGDYPSALRHLQQALEYYEGQGDRELVANLQINIGNVNLGAGNYEASLDHFGRALAIHEDMGNLAQAHVVIGNMGSAHLHTGNLSAAKDCFRRALAAQDDLGMKDSAAGIASNLACALIESERFDEARAMIAKLQAKAIDDASVRIRIISLHARLLAHDGDMQQAADSYRLALSEANERGLRSQVADVHKALRDLALKQNDLQEYVRHNDAHTQVTEEIRGAETRIKIAMQEKQKEVEAMEREHERERAVLYSTLPKHIADRVVRGEDVSGDRYDGAAVVFVDVVDFTVLSSNIPPNKVVRLLDVLFRAFDGIIERHRLVKIKTIGDAYLAVAFPGKAEEGAPPAQRAATAATELIEASDELRAAAMGEDLPPIRIRVGMDIGPIVAGIIGTDRLQYDVWGDTVNTASRMESTGESGRIHVSEAFAAALRSVPPLSPGDASDRGPAGRTYHLVECGAFEVKGKGSMDTYWLEMRSP